MSPEEMNDLRVGDLVRHATGGPVLIVTANYGNHVTAVTTRDLTNPPEWDVVSKAGHHRPQRHNGTFAVDPDDPYTPRPRNRPDDG